MSNFKFIAKLPKAFRGFQGLQASIFNSKGQELASQDLDRNKIQFKLDRSDALVGKRKARLSFQVIDDNGDDVNFIRGGKPFDLNPDRQTFKARIFERQGRVKKGIRLKGKEIITRDTVGPVFDKGSPLPLDENSGSGIVVFQAKAKDDSGDPVTYQLKGADAKSFSIDAKTGTITLNENPDFETKPSYAFTVVASDAEQNATSKSFTLKINDLDEVAPVFKRGGPIFLPENAGDNAFVVKAEASDDSGSPVTYQLSGQDADAFTIDPVSGNVMMNRSADFERKNQYIFDVTATDKSNNSALKTFTLKITDVKDTGDTIELTPFTDFYTSGSGYVWNSYDLLPNEFELRKERLSVFDDYVNAAPLAFGTRDTTFNDRLYDPSTLDNDILTVSTGKYNPFSGFASVLPFVQNIETLEIFAGPDMPLSQISPDIRNKVINFDLKGFTGLKTVSVTGGTKNNILFRNYLGTGVDSFDFSSLSGSSGVFLFPEYNDKKSSRDLTVYGSFQGDSFFSGVGSMHAYGGEGRDQLGKDNNANASVYLAGEEGRDNINLSEDGVRRQDTVSLKGITNNADSDGIFAFTGAGNLKSSGSIHDLLEFDAKTFSNYTANQPVRSASVIDTIIDFNKGNARALENVFLKDGLKELERANLSEQGYKNVLGIGIETFPGNRSDEGHIMFSRNGNFAANGVVIATLRQRADEIFSDPNGFIPSENVSIV